MPQPYRIPFRGFRPYRNGSAVYHLKKAPQAVGADIIRPQK